MSVYCKGCNSDFPQYKAIGGAIKDKILPEIAGAVLDTGSHVLSAVVFAGKLDSALVSLLGRYEFFLSLPDYYRILRGSRREACNVAHVPCPKCERFVRWKRR